MTEQSPIFALMTKQDILSSFNPNDPGQPGQLFGFPFTPETSELVIIPVPWEVTVSYHSGTAGGPQAILDASAQVDVAMKDITDAWKLGVSMLPFPNALYEESVKLRDWATNHIAGTTDAPKAGGPAFRKINEACENLNV